MRETYFFYNYAVFKSSKKDLTVNLAEVDSELRKRTKLEHSTDEVSIEVTQVLKLGIRRYLLISKVTYR